MKKMSALDQKGSCKSGIEFDLYGNAPPPQGQSYSLHSYPIIIWLFVYKSLPLNYGPLKGSNPLSSLFEFPVPNIVVAHKECRKKDGRGFCKVIQLLSSRGGGTQI